MSWVTIGVFVVIAAASVAGFAAMRRAVDNQNHALVREDVLQAATVVQGLVANLGGTVNTVSALAAVNASRGSIGPNSAQEIANLAHGFSVALAQPAPAGGYRVTYAQGPAYAVGQTLTGPVADAVAGAGSQLSETKVFTAAGRPYLALVQGAPTAGLGTVVVQFPLQPYAAARAPNTVGPFSDLAGAVYATPTQDPSQVVLATTTALPVTGDFATAPVNYQNVHWWVVGRERSGLTPVGSFADLSPWLVLALGVFLAALMAVITAILVRRQRFAAAQVALRTRELETSLDDLRSAQEALVRNERLSAVGEMASVVGHELRNPLTAVTNSHYLLRQALGDPAPPAAERHLAMAERETAKATTLAEDLTAFVRPREPVFAPVRLDEIVHEVLEATPAPVGVDVAVRTDGGVIEADRGQITEVLVNLITNAYQALPEGGAVTVSAAATNGSAHVEVADTGTGVDPDIASRLFEPFFTTKANGTGLGLAIVRRLVEAHGGQVSLQGRAPHGTAVVVDLPVAQGGVK